MADAITAAQLLTPAASFVAAGAHFIASYLAIPAIKDLPVAVSTTKFANIYYDGLPVLVGLVATSATTSAVLAYQLPGLRRTYATAGLLTVSTLPWTAIVMFGNIQELLRISGSAEAANKVSSSAVSGMLSTWAWQNVIRSMFPLIGGFIGLSALLPKSVQLA